VASDVRPEQSAQTYPAFRRAVGQDGEPRVLVLIKGPASSARAHPGVETQPQWSGKAIARTTPALLGLSSLITLWAGDLLADITRPYVAAWYRKKTLTFVDAIGAVRLALWVGDIYRTSPRIRDMREIPPDHITHMAEALCFAA